MWSRSRWLLLLAVMFLVFAMSRWAAKKYLVSEAAPQAKAARDRHPQHDEDGPDEASALAGEHRAAPGRIVVRPGRELSAVEELALSDTAEFYRMVMPLREAVAARSGAEACFDGSGVIGRIVIGFDAHLASDGEQATLTAISFSQVEDGMPVPERVASCLEAALAGPYRVEAPPDEPFVRFSGAAPMQLVWHLPAD